MAALPAAYVYGSLKSMLPAQEPSGFDRYSRDYDSYLNDALAKTGEDKDYFATGRVQWLARCLRELRVTPVSVLDFGCGIGTAAPLLLTHLGCRSVIGVDPSSTSIERARELHPDSQFQFLRSQDFHSRGELDCAYCNGVFHHIPSADRPAALGFIREALRPGGIFGFWENNPWNPGTRYVMSRCAFDEDAVKISAIAARHMLRRAGFEVLRTDFLFFFPRALAALRWLEPSLRKIPLGGQYQVLCRKLSATASSAKA